MKNIIIIPVYKPEMCPNENISFVQAVTILNKHSFCLVTNQNCNLSQYFEILDAKSINYIIKYFDEDYFSDIDGYNRLMLNKIFYQEFEVYDYMLVYQLDAFVFRDELEYWCERGYDYIGSPWFVKRSILGRKYNSSIEGGNGGFSLRKISYFLSVYSWRYPLIKPYEMLKMSFFSYSFFEFILKIPYIIFKWFGYRNNVKYFTNNKKSPINEDVFWSRIIQNSWLKVRLPDEMEASKFSFEQNPGYLYNLNNNTLPFGCHAWEKNELEFWITQIEKYGFKVSKV